MPKILIVEDDEVLRYMREKSLREEGFETCWTDASGRSLEIVQEGGIDLVILDVDEIRRKPHGPLLRGEGIIFLKKLRENTRFSKEKLPVIGTTKHLHPKDSSWEKEFMKAGGNMFFEEPFSRGELVSAVRSLLGLGGKGQER
jgi:CheY-like chemotaxis protein